MSLFGELPSNVAGLQAQVPGQLLKWQPEPRKTWNAYTIQKQKNLFFFNLFWVSESTSRVESSVWKCFQLYSSSPTLLFIPYDHSFRFIVHPIHSSAGVTNVGMRPINTVSVRLLFLILPFPSLLCLFLFDISCVVFLGKEVRERKHDGHFPNGVDVCVIWSDRTAVSLLHCCCISDPFGGSLIIVSLSLCVCAAAIYLHLSLVFCLPSRRVGTDLVWRR